MTAAAQPVQRSRRRRWFPYILSLPALIVCIGILIPFVTAVYYSMLRYRLNLPALKGFIWFNNYISFLNDPEFWNTVRVSLLYTGLTVGVEVLFGLAIALLLQRRTLFNNMVSIALLLPLMTAPALAVLMWKLMTNPNFGVLSYLVQSVGVSNFKWASAPSTALFTVVLVDVWVYTPFIMILLLAGLCSLPTQPFEAAALGGVPRRFVFFRITLPMLLPYMMTAALFRLLDAIQQFDIIYPVVNADRVCFAIANGPTLNYAASDIPQGARKAIGSRARVVVGVRPHSLRLGSGALDAGVVSNQWLGDQTHIALHVGGQFLVAVSHAPVSAKSGERLRCAIAPENLHLFDADSGAALSHGLEAA